jgi:hypothetical protein
MNLKRELVINAATVEIARATKVLSYIKINHPKVFQEAMDAVEGDENGVQPTDN